MRMMRPTVALAGMLIAFPVGLFAQGAGDAPRRTAEANVAKAAALRLKQTSKDFDAAIVLLRESARLFQSGRWTAQEADAYLRIGEIYFTSGKYERALNSYRRVLTLTGDDPDLRARTLSQMARTNGNWGHLSEADESSKQALDLIEQLTNKKTQAEVLEARGETFYWSGDYEHAVKPLRQALDLYADGTDDDARARALLALARAVNGPDRLEALRLSSQALRMWSAVGNLYGAAQARAFLATLSARAGEYETAQCNCKEARKTFQQVGDRDSEATVLNTLGFLNMQTGDPQQSLNFYRQARDAFANAGDRLGEAGAITGMGRAAAALKEYAQLLPWYEAKLRLAQKAGSRNYIASAQANLGDVYEKKREFTRAEAFYGLSLKGYRAVHNPFGEGRVLIQLAHVYSEEERFSQAIAALKQARELKDKAGQVEEVAQIDYELASIYRKQGRLEDARQAIENTIGIIESQRLKMSAFDSRAAYFASVHEYYSLYIQLLMLLQSRNSQNQLAETALEASERSKVRSLLDWLAGHSQDARCDELLERQADIAAAPAPTAGSNVASSESSPALTLDQIQAEIAGDDAILLEYALGDEKSYVWVVSGEQVSPYELPSLKRLNELVQGFRAAVTARQARDGESNEAYLARIGKADTDYRRYRAQLSHVLLEPVSLSGAKRIIIVPDGPLQYVSFAALSVPDERGGQSIMAAHHEVIMLPSASALGVLRKAVALRPAPTSTAAVFADPVYELNDTRGSSLNRSQGPGVAQRIPFVARSEWLDIHGSRHIPRLIWSGAEASEVGKLGKANDVLVARRFEASRDNVLNHDLGSYRIIHFATHGVADPKHPERSGLILSLFDRKGSPKDGYLRLSDIYGLKLSADLVVLSSCDSGLGKDLSSEGIIGLPRAFLRAGARSVIASLWKVDDQATAQLMTYFYAHLRKGEGPASALRSSQGELARDQRWSHPYYWATFVFQGDYRIGGVK